MKPDDVEKAPVELLRRLIAENEDWLMDKILEYAKEHDYVKYTSTLKEAWRISVSGLSKALLAALRDDHPNLELGPDDQFADDPIAQFSSYEARLHRVRGISLSMFLGLMKYYRQGYKDLVREAGFDPNFEGYCLNLVERCFDRFEIAFCVEWSEFDQNKLISELQEKNRQITNEKNKYLTIFESHPHMVFILDSEICVNNLNHSAAQRFHAQEVPGAEYYGTANRETDVELSGDLGSEPDTFHSKPAGELLPWLADDIEAFVKGKSMLFNMEKKVFFGNKEHFYNVTFSQILDVSEKFSGAVVVLEDITDRKQTERELAAAHEIMIKINRQLQEVNAALKERTDELDIARDKAESANRAKSTFLANMSHELRTPLNAILGFTQLMTRDDSLSDSGRKNLAIVNRSGEHLLTMINDVLDLSKIEAGKIELNEEPFDLPRTMEEIGEMIRSRATPKGLDVTVALDPGIERHVRADRGKLLQILINLLGNAVKFTEAGWVALRVRTTPFPDDPLRRYLEVEVEDTGPGIPSEKKDAIFDPFAQVGSIKASQKGTGLGLTISRSFVSLMEGELTVESEEEKGSLFRIRVPVEVVTKEDVTSSTAPPLAVVGLEPGQPEWRVLIVEDNPENSQLLETILTRVGFSVRTACNGLEGIKTAEAWRPHFIWMDIKMPVMDGYEASRRIRALPWGGDIVIFALTASVYSDQVESIIAAGCNGVLHKPFRERELFEIMARRLGLRYLYEDARNKRGPGLSDGGLCLVPSAAELSTLPADLLDRIIKAAVELNKGDILAVASELEENQAKIAAFIREHVASYDFETIVRLVESANGEKYP